MIANVGKLWSVCVRPVQTTDLGDAVRTLSPKAEFRHRYSVVGAGIAAKRVDQNGAVAQAGVVIPAGENVVVLAVHG